jgi:hypothetical protein
MFNLILLYLAFFMGGMPALLYKLRATVSEENRFIAPFAYLIAISSIYESTVTLIFNVDSTVWFKMYTLLEFLCIFYFFLKLLHKQYRPLLYGFLVFFVITFIILQLLWLTEGKSETDSYLAIIETLFVYTMTFLWFKDIFTNRSLDSLWDSPAFYFISGFILYFSGTLFLFLMSDFVLTQQESGRYWIINVVLSLFFSIILLIGIWKGQIKSIRYSG